MSTAFALTLAHLGERCSATDGAAASAAYITGNVASNLVGRLIAAAVADHLGLPAAFLMLAALNLSGAIVVYFWLARTPLMADTSEGKQPSPLSAMLMHFRNPPLRAAFGIGFCILFAFIGTFTYVNFVLVRAPLSLSMMGVGFVYFVFLPSIVTTPIAGRVAARFGAQATLRSSLVLAALGLPLLLLPSLAGSPLRPGAHRRRHVLRAGLRYRLRQPHRGERSRLGKRHLPRLLLLRGTRRQRSARTDLRSPRLGRLRCGHRRVADRRGFSRQPSQDIDRAAIFASRLSVTR